MIQWKSHNIADDTVEVVVVVVVAVAVVVVVIEKLVPLLLRPSGHY